MATFLLIVSAWGFPAQTITRGDVWLAAVAEMADRVQANRWVPNLSLVLDGAP